MKTSNCTKANIGFLSYGDYKYCIESEYLKLNVFCKIKKKDYSLVQVRDNIIFINNQELHYMLQEKCFCSFTCSPIIKIGNSESYTHMAKLYCTKLVTKYVLLKYTHITIFLTIKPFLSIITMVFTSHIKCNYYIYNYTKNISANYSLLYIS